MAVLEASVSPKAREKMKNGPKNVKKVLVVAQELKLARVLAGNNKTSRDRALKSLRKWFQNRSTAIPFTDDDFMRLWKGLFYSMWMSDKPLIQEECAENISNLIHSLPLDAALLFYKCGMVTLMNEWFGIDQLRLDKFLLFVRRLLRQALFVLKNQNWTKGCVPKFAKILSETILNPEKQKPLGLLLHFIEIFLEELSKVGDSVLPPNLVTDIIRPFIKQLAFTDDSRIIDTIRKHIFIYLIRQSDLGLEYEEKYKAWRALRFPGSIDSMKKIEVPDEGQSDDEDEQHEDEEKEKVFDPRAGRVDVDLPQIKFHPKAVSKALSELKFEKNTNAKSRRCLNEFSEHFKKLASGVYPLGVKKVKIAKDDFDMSIRKAVNRLVKFEKKIQGKKKQKRKHEEHEIELRGGKKIKLDDELKQKIQNDFRKLSKKKRLIEDSESPPKKIRKSHPTDIDGIFKRNSGTWIVTKGLNISMDSSLNQSDFETSSLNGSLQTNSNVEPETEEKTLFPKISWDTSDLMAEKFNHSFKKKRLSLPENLLKNPFAKSTPVKRVKINTKLNRSQDFYEHRAQILSSPAIPYDANKKPSKPLLKSPAMKSPINPFYFK